MNKWYDYIMLITKHKELSILPLEYFCERLHYCLVYILDNASRVLAINKKPIWSDVWLQ